MQEKNSPAISLPIRHVNLWNFFTGLSFALVPSKEDYFISTSGYSVPKPSIFKIGPEYTVPIEEEEDKGGVFSDVGNFFRTGFDKIKNLVAPNNDAEVYEIHQPHTYSLGTYFILILQLFSSYFGLILRLFWSQFCAVFRPVFAHFCNFYPILVNTFYKKQEFVAPYNDADIYELQLATLIC